MQMVPRDNEVAGEGTVLKELQRAKLSAMAEFLTCHFRKSLKISRNNILHGNADPSLSFFLRLYAKKHIILLRLGANRQIIPHSRPPSFPPIFIFLSISPFPPSHHFSLSSFPHVFFHSFSLCPSIPSHDSVTQALEPDPLRV